MHSFRQLVAAAAVFALSAGAAVAEDAKDATPSVPETPPARMEVAFVLDSTGSMSGLIEGAKRKIWSIANNLTDLEPQPEIRFALITYRDRGDVYVTKTYDLTADVQQIYADLLEIKASGGGDTPESVNQALSEAVNDLSWSQEDEVFRVIFLVGDAPPHMDYQDDTPYPETLKVANKRDIVVNAVQAGGMRVTTKIWKEIAKLGGGEFARIAQDGGMVSIETPYDGKINELTRKISGTVVPYGGVRDREATRSKLERNLSAGAASSAEMSDYLAKRSAGAKPRGVVTGGGDLVADIAEGDIDLETLPESELPKELRALEKGERAAFLEKRAGERAALRTELDALLAKRRAYVAKARADAAAAAPADAFDERVKAIVRDQAAKKGFK